MTSGSRSAGLAAAGAERLYLRWLCAASFLIPLFLIQIPLQGQTKDKPPDKTKSAPKPPETKPETVKPAPLPAPPPAPPAIDKFKLPPGTIGLVFDGIKDALSNLQPDMIFMTPKKYREMLDKIETLEKLLKPERQTIHGCKLTGKLDDNSLLLRAEIAFVTDQPRALVPLGLKGANLVDEGNLDQQNLTLERDADDGYIIRANKADRFNLVLNLRVPISQRRTGGSGERGFEFGLPGASVTTLTLDLAKSVREIRWNDMVEKASSPGHWERLSLGSVRTLDVSWKEQAVLPGTEPLLTADGQIKVKLAETYTLVDAELTLEDLRGKAKEWRLLVPEKAKVEMLKVPASLVSDIQAEGTDGNKHDRYVIKFLEPHAERFTIGVQMRVPRPAGGAIPKLAVGPFLVANAFSQKGTIVVLAPPSSLRGQRLIFHRFGDVNQHDTPKGSTPSDTAAIFQYAIPKGAAPAKAPLEIEWRAEKGLVETSVEHQLKLRRTAGGLQIDSLTQIKVKSLSAGVDFLDVQLPRLHPPYAGLFAWSVAGGFPGGAAWGGLLDILPRDITFAQPTTDFFCQDDTNSMELSPPDSQGKARVKFIRPPTTKEFLVTLEGKYQAPGQSHRLRLELPRPLGILDRGGKATISADEQVELLEGPASAEEPVPIGQTVPTQLDPATNAIEFAWRPYHPQLPAHNDVAVILHGKSAHIRQEIKLLGANRLAKLATGSGNIRLRVPKSVLNLKVDGESSLIMDNDQQSVWVKPPEDRPLVVEFDQALPATQESAQLWKVPLIWPADSAQLEARVRVWSDPGVVPHPANLGDLWQELPSDVVDNQPSLPVLVLQGAGKDLELTLRLPPATAGYLPLFLCDRGLIQVFIDEMGNHLYRARYVLKKLNADYIEVEFPILIDSCTPQITASPWSGLGAKRFYIPFEKERKLARLKIDPSMLRENVLLDIEFTIPANFTDGSAWQTTLSGPVLRGGDFLGRLRWAVALPGNWVSIVASRNTQQDVHWSLQGGLLTPEPDVHTSDLEKWLTGREGSENGVIVSQVFGKTHQEPILLLHFARQTWLLLCSGFLLMVSMLLYLLPLRRSVFWVVVVVLGLTLVVAGFLWPTWVPALLYGCQLGIVVLFLGMGIEWLRHERYRRQVVFMPGFTRVKPGSSLLKPAVSASRPREPSTVDVPAGASLPGRGSSIKGQVGKEQ